MPTAAESRDQPAERLTRTGPAAGSRTPASRALRSVTRHALLAGLTAAVPARDQQASMMTNGTFGELDQDALSRNRSSFPALRLESRSLATSATMFAVGVLGNLVAIVVLCVSKKEQKETTFYTLVCGMAVTDLLGTCLTSPVVIATYVSSRWPGGALLCRFFSSSMLFFGSAGTSVLCAMAVERYLAISHAYFYSQHVDRAVARLALLGTYLANMALCVMPSFGFGRHVRHFPGTWCFLDWRAADPLGACYSFLYGGVMLLLIAVTVLCNVAVCASLLGMRQRSGTVRTELCGPRRRCPRLPAATSAAEIQMFWLLVLMTSVFLVCSVPLVVRIFVNQLHGPSNVSAGGEPDYRSDMLAIRFASFNPILDPWVYILCRKNLLLKGCGRLKRAVAGAKEGPGGDKGWVGGHHSPPSPHSNDTSYASLRMASFHTGHPEKNMSFTDFTTRPAWEFDASRANFHPFCVESAATVGCEEAAAAEKSSPGRSCEAHTRRVDIVTCTFSTPSSTQSGCL